MLGSSLPKGLNLAADPAKETLTPSQSQTGNTLERAVLIADHEIRQRAVNFICRLGHGAVGQAPGGGE